MPLMQPPTTMNNSSMANSTMPATMTNNNGNNEDKLNAVIQGLEYQNELDKQRFKRREEELLGAIREKDAEIERLRRDKSKLIKTCDELSYKTMELDRDRENVKLCIDRLKEELQTANQMNIKLKNQLFQIYKNYDNKEMMVMITSRLSSIFHPDNHENIVDTTTHSSKEIDLKTHKNDVDHHVDDNDQNDISNTKLNDFTEQINLMENKLRDLLIKQVESPLNHIMEKIQKNFIEKEDNHKILIEKLFKNNQSYQHDIRKEIKYLCEQNKVIFDELKNLKHKQKQEQELLLLSQNKINDHYRNDALMPNTKFEKSENLNNENNNNNSYNKENEMIKGQNIENELNQMIVVAENEQKPINKIAVSTENGIETAEKVTDNKVKKRRANGVTSRTKKSEKILVEKSQQITEENDGNRMSAPKKQGRKKIIKNDGKTQNNETVTINNTDDNVKAEISPKTKTTNVRRGAANKLQADENENKKTVTVTRNLRKKLNDVVITVHKY